MEREQGQAVLIRPYDAKDHDRVQYICVGTGPEMLNERPEMRDFLLNAFCNYYIEKEPQNCFVAADKDQAIGYILCAENTKAWAEVFPGPYAPEDPQNPIGLFYEGSKAMPLKFAEDYPAHLHIDILDDYQRQGIGFRLMDALTAHLRAKGVPGVMLSVGADNEKGKNFYRKYGFSVLEETEHEIGMGLRLQP